MSANPVPQTPVEPPASPALTPHDRHVGAIAAWLWGKCDEDLLVEVVTGPNRTEVARGRYVDMEAHPSAKGVYRLVFDNSKAGPGAPTGQQWVAVGHELVDVAAGDTSLILDKGSQRVEVHVLDALPASAPVAQVAAPAPPVTVPADRTASATVEAPSLIEAYAPTIEALATAPFYQNSAILASRLFGETKLTIDGDELHVTARRMRHGTAFFVMLGIVIGAFAPAGVILYLIQVLAPSGYGAVTPLDVQYANYTLYGTVAVVAVALVFYVLGRLLSAGREPETIVVPLSQASGRKHGRIFMLKGPVGRNGRRRRLVLKPAGKAESARLTQLLTHLRG